MRVGRGGGCETATARDRPPWKLCSCARALFSAASSLLSPLSMSQAQAKLLQLAQDGRAEDLAAALSHPDAPSLEFVDGRGLSPLMHAAKEDHAAVCEALLGVGHEDDDAPRRVAAIDYQSPHDGRTALHVAAWYGALDAIDVLVKAGADATIPDGSGKTAMQYEEVDEDSSSDARSVRAFLSSALSAFANPIEPDDDEEAAAEPTAEAEADEADEAAEEPTSTTEEDAPEPLSDSDRMLHEACRTGNLTAAQRAMDMDAHPDRPNPATGLTPLMLAAKGGYLALVQFLIEEAAADRDAQHARSQRNTALMFAVRHGQVDCVSWMISKGACAVFGLSNDDGESADTIIPIEKVTAQQMEDVISSALATADSKRASAQRPAATVAASSSAILAPGARPEQKYPEEPAEQEQERETPPPAARAVASPPKQSTPPQQPQRQEKTPEPAMPEDQHEDDLAEPQQETDESEQPELTLEQQRQRQRDLDDRLDAQDRARAEAEMHSRELPSYEPPHAPVRQFDPNDTRAFLELPLAQAIALLIARYNQTCADFNQQPVPFIVAALQNLQYSGLNLLLSGTSVGQARTLHRLSDESLYPLLEVLNHAFPNCPLRSLDLSFNHLARTSGQGVAQFIAQSSSLTAVNLEGNDLERQAGEMLAEVLSSRHSSLVRLNLHSNALGPQALTKLAAMLSVNQTLTELNLGNTDCDMIALLKLSTALQNNRILKRLNIDNPLLFSAQEETTIHIARTLASNRSLVSISMKGHHMTDSGAAWLAEFLLPNASLTEIDLRRNALSTTAVAGFVRSIAHRPVECLILLDSNLLKGQTFEDIEQAIADNKGRNTVVWTSRQDKHSLRAKAPL